MANEVRIRTSVKDDASKPLKDMQDAFGRWKKAGVEGLAIGVAASATTMAFNVLGNAVGSVTDYLKDAVAGAIDEQRSIAQLSQVLKANAADWNGNMDAVDRAADAAARLGFTDDAVRASLTKLVPATHSLNDAIKLQATAMDLARLKGISLEDASQALVKVEAGQYRALKDLGIVLKDGATSTEALAAVQKVAMGQAAAYADTLTGKMERLDVKFKELQDEVGNEFVPVVTDAITVMVDYGDIIDMATGKQARNNKTIIDFTRSVAAFLPFGQALQKEIDKVGDTTDTTTGEVFDLRGEFAKANDTSNIWRKSLVPLNTGLRTTGQIAKDIVDEMIAMRREAEFLWDNGRGNGDKPKTRSTGSNESGRGIGSAIGGPVAPGVHLVGENGPELVRLTGYGTVEPSVSTIGGSGATVVNVNVSTPVMTPGAAQALADAIGPAITRWQQARGL